MTSSKWVIVHSPFLAMTPEPRGDELDGELNITGEITMKKSDVIKIVVEGVASVVIGIFADSITKKLKESSKKKDFDSTMVGDLTVSELKDIIRGEA